MNEVQKLRFAELSDKDTLTAKETKELESLTALKVVELASKPIDKPVIKGYTIGTNANYSGGQDEQTAVESVGLKYSKPINMTLIVNSVTKVTKGDQSFYSVKADSLTDEPIDLTVSLHHYESFGFSNLLPIGFHVGKVLRVKVVNVTTECGYLDKKTSQVIRYWRNGIFIVEPRAELSEKEVTAKTIVNTTSQIFMSTLDLLCGGKFDANNESHLNIMSKMQR